MNRLGWVSLVAFTVSSLLSSMARAQPNPSMPQGERLALVIGNSHYGGGDDVSGIEDAKEMSTALQQIGFKRSNVKLLLDGSRDEIVNALDEFGMRIRLASVVVFFFSGHGFQNGAENYLVPIGGSAAPASALSLTMVKNTLAWAPNQAVKLVFLDACRKYKKLPPGAPEGLREEQVPSSPRTLYAFAAGPGLNTPAGKPTEISPYSKILLHYLNEPGLKISEFLDKVTRDSALAGRLPSYVVNGVPSDFYLRDPVFLRAEVDNVDGNLLVVVNGDVVLNSNQESSARLPLKSGRNELRLLMSKGKSYHNGHTWDVTEGWGYNLKIGPDAAQSISCSGPGRNGYCFSGEEPHPFKDGPHHGGAFLVATATLVVDGNAEQPKVSLEDNNSDIWRQKAPLWARDQELLYEESVRELNLTPQDIIGGLRLEPPWNVIVPPLAQRFLETGDILGYKLADPSRTFATVWGNRGLRDAVQACMTSERSDRIRDLKASITAVFARENRPFRRFDDGLADCVRRNGGAGALADGDIRVWTAIRDRSKELTTRVPDSSQTLSRRLP